MLVSRDWAADLAPLGLTPLGEIGSGMEGTVLRLEGDLVAKVWHAAGTDELAVRQRFYADVATRCRCARPGCSTSSGSGTGGRASSRCCTARPLAGPLTTPVP